MKKILVLDVGGVLASNLSPSLWQQLAALGQCEEQLLYAAYKEEMSEKLWCGHYIEAEWWNWLAARGIAVRNEQRAALIATHLRPLPALDKLAAWAKQCSILIMSNHRSEWLLPLLEPHVSALQAIHISDQAGLRKPDPRWFQKINATLERPCDVMFVDDSLKNVHAAQACGWLALRADQHGEWVKQIDEWLH